MKLTGRHTAGDDLGDDVGRLVAQWRNRAVVRRRQAVQFVLHDAGLLVVLGVPGGERRHHRPQPDGEARGRIVGPFERSEQAAVPLQGDGVEQLLFGAVVRVHGRRAHVEAFGDLAVELPPYPDSAKASIAARRMRSAADESATRSMVMTVGILHVFDFCRHEAHY